MWNIVILISVFSNAIITFHDPSMAFTNIELSFNAFKLLFDCLCHLLDNGPNMFLEYGNNYFYLKEYTCKGGCGVVIHGIWCTLDHLHPKWVILHVDVTKHSIWCCEMCNIIQLILLVVNCMHLNLLFIIVNMKGEVIIILLAISILVKATYLVSFCLSQLISNIFIPQELMFPIVFLPHQVQTWLKHYGCHGSTQCFLNSKLSHILHILPWNFRFQSNF
jgi:hypothetical protein